MDWHASPSTVTADDDCDSVTRPPLGAIGVLLVDDHCVVRHGLRMFLSLDPELAIVGEAGNGLQAIELAHRLRPAVIVMDLLMPTLDGLVATQIIKQALPEIEILALTCVLDDDMICRAIHAGVMGYLLKDAKVDDLARAIKAAAHGEVQLHPEAAKRLIREVRMPESSDRLTDREVEVLKLVARGLSNRVIAQRLVLSEKTVKTHVSSVLSKLNVPSRTAAALHAVRSGLVSLDGP